MYRLLTSLLAVLFFSACGGVDLPIDCRLKGCPEGQVCKKIEVADPEGVDPEFLRYFDDAGYICVPAPTPTPTPAPTPTPTPTPTPEDLCNAVCEEACVFEQDRWLCPDPPPPPPEPCINEASLIPSSCLEGQFRTRIKVATSSLGDLTGGDPNENLRLLAAKLREQNPGICVIAGIEALFLKRTDGFIDEVHAVHFGTGGWTDNGFGKYIGCHSVGPVHVGCGEPTPPPAWKIVVRRHGGRPNYPKFDSTGKVGPNELEYCTSVGFKNRAECPVRPECDGSGECKFKDREACELATFGLPSWRSDGSIEDVAEKNPWQRHVVSGTWVQVCTGPEIVAQVCSDVLYY